MRQRRSTEARKEEIIRAALVLVEEYGLDNVSINDIAAKIELVPSAIYRHFAGREEIIAALVDFTDSCLRHNAAEVMAHEGSVIAKLTLLFDLHIKLLKEEGAVPRILFFLLSSDRNPELKANMLASVNRYVQQINRLLLQGQETGEISDEVDARASAMLFLGMIQPLAVLGQVDKAMLNDYPPKLWQSYLRSILPAE